MPLGQQQSMQEPLPQVNLGSDVDLERIVRIAQQVHPQAQVVLFGSRARGDHRPDSDVDLLVTLSPGTSALALGGLLMDAEELLGRRVDVVTEASLHPALRDRVLADAVPL